MKRRKQDGARVTISEVAGRYMKRRKQDGARVTSVKWQEDR